VESGEWELPVSQDVVRIYAMFIPQIKHNKPPAVKEATLGETFTQEVFSILHSSPVEEKNGIFNLQRLDPSAFQGERATSPFSED
jgi:hypothetical protein